MVNGMCVMQRLHNRLIAVGLGSLFILRISSDLIPNAGVNPVPTLPRIFSSLLAALVEVGWSKLGHSLVCL